MRHTINMSIKSLQKAQDAFAKDRNWEQFHSIRNLALALVGEVGELAEVIQWEGEIDRSFFLNNPSKSQAFKEEIADIFLYTLRLADIVGIDIEDAAEAKMVLNAKKYPVEHSYGNSEKRSL